MSNAAHELSDEVARVVAALHRDGLGEIDHVAADLLERLHRQVQYYSNPPPFDEAQIRADVLHAVDAYSHRCAENHPGKAAEHFVNETVTIIKRGIRGGIQAPTELARGMASLILDILQRGAIQKGTEEVEAETMRSAYDFSSATRGQHAARYAAAEAEVQQVQRELYRRYATTLGPVEEDRSAEGWKQAVEMDPSLAAAANEDRPAFSETVPGDAVLKRIRDERDFAAAEIPLDEIKEWAALEGGVTQRYVERLFAEVASLSGQREAAMQPKTETCPFCGNVFGGEIALLFYAIFIEHLKQCGQARLADGDSCCYE